MSYDLQLFRAAHGETFEQTLARFEAAESSDELNPGPIVPGLEHAKHRLADALIRQMPSLEKFIFDYKHIAAIENVDEAEARRKWRHIELNDDQFGWQIMLSDETASAALPYWHEGAKAEAAFRVIWGCLDVLHTEVDYFSFDPQLDRVLNLGSGTDFSAVVERYLSIKHSAEKAVRGHVPEKPWWNFW